MRIYSTLLMVVWWFCWKVGAARNGLDLHLITVVNDDNPSYGFHATAPMYEVAFENAKSIYGDLFNSTIRTNLYQPELITCPLASALMLSVSAKIYDAIREFPDYWPVIFTPGCSLEVISLGDFAREWDVPLISAVGSDQTLRDKIRFPSVVTFPGSDHQNVAKAMKQFLDKYNWRTLTFYCDAVTQYTAVATYYPLSWANIRRTLEADVGRYMIYQHMFDSKNFTDFTSLLNKMKQQSRVAVLFTHPLVLRRILILAHQLNMTSGDYVFIVSQATRVPTVGEVTWRYNDDNDQDAFQAYKSLIVVNNRNPEWERIPQIVAQYGAISASKFNKNFTADQQLNEVSIGVYESFMAFSSVLNDSKTEVFNLTGRQFISKFFSRSFSFPSRKFFIGPTGMRSNDAVFSRLNLSSGLMQDSWRYSALTGALESVSSLANQWPGDNGPPPDKPICGYLNDLCYTGAKHIEIIAGSVAALAVILAATGAVAFCWRRWQKNDNGSLWWILDASSVQDIDFTSAKLLNVLRAERAVCFINASKVRAYDVVRRLVWLEEVSSSHPGPASFGDNKAIRHTLSAVKGLSHENLSSFLGILQTGSKSICSVFEYGQRGSLRCLLESGQTAVDAPLQSSLIWETISGLAYIHASQLRSHGLLNSLCVMVDRRFCIKICNYGTLKLRHALHSSPISQNDADPAVLWIPPEAFGDPGHTGSKEGDIFSLSIVICEILTKATPLATKLASTQSVRESVQIVHETPAEARIETSNIPPAVRSIILSCMDPLPTKRPTLPKFRANLSRTVRPVRLIESLLSRLERHAVELESIVGHRTQELLREQRKADDLLKEILPPSLVAALRNHHHVPAEYFDAVTILFSDLPIFGSLCAECAPAQIFPLLNELYSVCDRTLSHYDVYKVETINDSYVVSSDRRHIVDLLYNHPDLFKVASGLPVPNGRNHAGDIARMALGMQDVTRFLVAPMDASQKLQLRMGVNTGPCAAGMVGLKMPRYCIFGDTMNTASRMQSHGAAGEIHISQSTKLHLNELEFLITPRGAVQIKGKGEMETFWLKKRG